MLADTIRHKTSRETYDIDGFINQLLASRKFDELAEKVADKAAVRIMHVEAAPARLERFSEVNKVNKTTENSQKSYRDQPPRDFEKTDADSIKLRNDNGQDKPGMIDTQAVMMDENTSQSNNLKLKYKYLTRNAYEKKVFSDRGSEKGDQPKRSETSDEKFRDHDTKAEEREEREEHTHQDTSEKKQHSSSKNEFMDENSRWRHDNKQRGDDRSDSESNRKEKSHIKSHDDMDSERNENSKNTHQRDDQDVRRDTIYTQNSRPEFKSIVKNEVHKVDHVDNSTEEEKVESSSAEAEKAEEEPDKSTSDENVTKDNDEVSHSPLRSRDETEPDIDENKITSDNQQEGTAYGYLYRSEEHKEQDEEPKSEEQGTEEHGSEEHKAEAQGTEEQHTAEQNTQEQRDGSEEEKHATSYKPVIRREGNKLYTYVEAPEYQEYHEQMAKMLKEHPINPADFMT
uniref:Uncharacterized protein n=1 Tax=Heliothis virescens TaxID=7102 RepID=A0A2A4JQ84_HELVI